MNVDENAKIIWDYMKLSQSLERADAIFVLCSHDIRVADRAAELFRQKLSKWLIVSGGSGKLTKDIFDKPEAEVFKERLLCLNVPVEQIIVESKATNTGENVRFVNELLQSLKLTFSSFILVQKPYMERRTYATFIKQWPDKSTEFRITSPQLSYDEYMDKSSIDKVSLLALWLVIYNEFENTQNLGFKLNKTYPQMYGVRLRS